MLAEDTIAAIATPPGEGGIGIVRISGRDALKIASEIFRPADDQDIAASSGYRIFYGHIIDPGTEPPAVIDEVLLSVFRAPRSFTAEDTAEINCHGGIVVLQSILQLTLRTGARLADPGEFTKRAFLNGRIDLVQAESVIDIIRARTEQSLQIAEKQLAGELSVRIRECRRLLLDIIAHIEALIDFPEDDIADLPLDLVRNETEQVLLIINDLLAQAETGRIYREGIDTAIIGRPNVGKSSLLNLLLRENRAIVSAIPGTTRDVIEENIKIAGIPLKLSDTAGIRETDDELEKIGVARSRESLNAAGLVLFLLDAEQGLQPEERQMLAELQQSGKKIVLICNKTDLLQVEEKEKLRLQLNSLLPGMPKAYISARNGDGLTELTDLMKDLLLSGEVRASDGPLVSNIRQQRCLTEAREYLYSACSGFEQGVPADLVSIDYRAAWEKLGQIIGESAGDEIVEQIFSQFCVGK